MHFFRITVTEADLKVFIHLLVIFFIIELLTNYIKNKKVCVKMCFLFFVIFTTFIYQLHFFVQKNVFF